MPTDLAESAFITYPMRPLNGARLESAKPKIGDWDFDLKVNGQRLLINTRTKQSWNRHGRFTERRMRAEYDDAIERLAATFQDVEWVDCEGLLRRHAFGKGALIVLDLVLPQLTLEQRYALMRERLRELPTNAFQIEPKALYRVPRYPWECAGEVWTKLREANVRDGLNAVFEGIVAKRRGTIYRIQKQSETKDSIDWQKHRFI